LNHRPVREEVHGPDAGCWRPMRAGWLIGT
jgi:hypothetical protein